MVEPLGEVLFEFIKIGPIVKVIAVHVETGIEAIIQAPAYLSQQTMQKNALAKLHYIMAKNKQK